MLFNVINYDNQVIGQVEASDIVEAWSEAGKKYENVLDVRLAIDLKEKLPTPIRSRDYPFYSPLWVAMHESIPRYFYHVPDNKVEFGKTIKAYKIQEPEAADSFGKGYANFEYVWLSPKVIYPNDAYIIDITKLNNGNMKFTGQVEGNILHKGDIPQGAVVAIKKEDGSLVLRGNNANNSSVD